MDFFLKPVELHPPAGRYKEHRFNAFPHFQIRKLCPLIILFVFQSSLQPITIQEASARAQK